MSNKKLQTQKIQKELKIRLKRFIEANPAIEDGLLWVSETGTPFVMDESLIVDPTEKQMEIVKKTEEELNVTIYAIIVAGSNPKNKTWNFLFVSNDASKWKEERSSLEDKFPVVYTYDLYNKFESQLGEICVNRNLERVG